MRKKSLKCNSPEENFIILIQLKKLIMNFNIQINNGQIEKKIANPYKDVEYM